MNRCDKFFSFEMKNHEGVLFCILSVRCDFPADHKGTCVPPNEVMFADGQVLKVLPAIGMAPAGGGVRAG